MLTSRKEGKDRKNGVTNLFLGILPPSRRPKSVPFRNTTLRLSTRLSLLAGIMKTIAFASALVFSVVLAVALDVAWADNHICACFLPDNCASGTGCLVADGDCKYESCPFPRQCLCTLEGRVGNTVTCDAMEDGWDICPENPEYNRRTADDPL